MNDTTNETIKTTAEMVITFPDIKVKCQGCGLAVEIRNEVAAND